MSKRCKRIAVDLSRRPIGCRLVCVAGQFVAGQLIKTNCRRLICLRLIDGIPLRSKAFYSIADKPTRVTATSSTLLDHILTNDVISQITPGILNSDDNDHFPTFVLNKNVDKKKVPASGKQVLQMQNQL